MRPEPTSENIKSVFVEVVRDEPARKRGRPTTLNVRLFVCICHLVERGMAISRACEACGVSYGRFRVRVSRSKRLQERLKEAETTRFNRRHEEALESIMEAGHRSWLAHAWWAERNLPEKYALKNVNRPEPVTINDANAIIRDVMISVPQNEFDEFKLMENTKVISNVELEHIECGVRQTIYLLE